MKARSFLWDTVRGLISRLDICKRAPNLLLNSASNPH